MTSAARNFVLFKTDLFVFYPRDEDIDRWIVGGDCAGWFYDRLLLVDRVQHYCEPVMEDWGWTFAVLVDSVKIWISVWAFKIENCWLFGVEPKKPLFRRQSSEAVLRSNEVVCGALENILMADARIVKQEWFAENPFELNVEEF